MSRAAETARGKSEFRFNSWGDRSGETPSLNLLDFLLYFGY